MTTRFSTHSREYRCDRAILSRFWRDTADWLPIWRVQEWFIIGTESDLNKFDEQMIIRNSETVLLGEDRNKKQAVLDHKENWSMEIGGKKKREG